MHVMGGGDVGGAKTQIMNTVTGLNRNNDVMLISFRAGPFADEARERGIDVRVIERHNPFRAARTMRDLVDAFKPDIIHCHGGRANLMGAMVPVSYTHLTIADGVAAIGAVFALSLPVVVRLKYFSKPLLNRFLKYGVPLMGVSISVALLNQIDKYLVVGFYGNILYAYYSNNNSIASGLFTMISVGIMRGVYPAVLRGWREGGKASAKPLLDQGVRL